VTPIDEELHLTAETDPDLWWRMLGHGAALATVTSLEVELHEVRELARGRLAWPIHRTGEVLAAYADAAADLPGEVSLDLCARLGGALTRQTPAAAVGRIEEPFLIFGVAIGAEDAAGEAVAETMTRLASAPRPHAQAAGDPELRRHHYRGRSELPGARVRAPAQTSVASTPTACCGSIRRCHCRTDLLDDTGLEHPR
jgi:hypothetical protein